MHYHSNATTNIAQRQYIKNNKDCKSSRDLADELKVSHVTCAKWANAGQTEDKTSKPHTINYVLSKIDERIIIAVRDKALLSLDDLLEALESYLPHLKRPTLYRTLLRYNRNKLNEEQKREVKQFAKYDPGFVHIDIFDLPVIEEQKYYCFLAIDRVTRLVLLEVYPRKTKREAADFLTKCLDFFPFRIHTILTDNGRQFTMRGQTSFGKKSIGGTLFEILCDIAQITYKKTKPYHPWTNGMAERMVGVTKEHTTKLQRYKTIQELIIHITKFQHYHNRHRRLRALNRKTPVQCALEWHRKKPELFLQNPIVWCKERDGT